MIKKPNPYSPKDYLKARDRDRIYRFVMDGGRIRGAYVQANLVVEEMARNHETGPLETFLLGQGYVAALLMGSTLKGDDRINVSIKTDGPMGGMSVDSNSYAEVRGYLDHSPIRVPSEWKDPTIAQTVGSGLLSVTRFSSTNAMPSTGSVEFSGGALATSLVHYFDQSEQIPTAIDVSVPFDRQGHALGAAGLILQALPGYDEARWNQAATRLREIPSIGENATESHDPEALLAFWFGEFEPQILDRRRVEFFCPCSKERFESVLKTLAVSDRDEILHNGPFPVETTCHNCASIYRFEKHELEILWRT